MVFQTTVYLVLKHIILKIKSDKIKLKLGINGEIINK